MKVTNIRSMDVGGYRYNYEGFYEKSIYQMSINKGRTTTREGGNYLLSSLSILVKSFEEEIQPYRDRVDTVRG